MPVTHHVTLTNFLIPVYSFSEGSLCNDLTDLSQISTPPVIGFSLPFLSFIPVIDHLLYDGNLYQEQGSREMWS